MAVMERVGAGTSLRAALVEAGEHWSAGQRRLVLVAAELDVSGEWELDRCATCAHWIALALDVEVCTAREWLRIGRALGELDEVNRAFAEGRLSYSKVRTLTRVATDANQAELCELAERVPAGRLRHALAAWLQRRESPAETEARHRQARSCGWKPDVDGMVVGGFRLAPAEAAIVTGAIDEFIWRGGADDASADASNDCVLRPSQAQQRADALVALVRGGGGIVVNEIVMHVRGDGCTLDDGTAIAGSVVERIAPEAFLRTLIHDAEARPINASGRHRHPSQRQRRVVHERDRVCVDCGTTDFLQYDHEPDYEQSRRTVVDELWLRCWTCHRARHRRAGGAW